MTKKQRWIAAIAFATACASSSGGQAADLEPVVSHPDWAATISVSGAFGSTDSDLIGEEGYEIGGIIGSADFVLPIRAGWNIQLSGAGRYDWLDFDAGLEGSNEQNLVHTLVFARDPIVGLFGVDLGLYSLGEELFGPADSTWNFVRAGAVAEWYLNELATIAAFGGGLFGYDNPYNDRDDGDGFYIGGYATFYAQQNWAASIDGRYIELSESFGDAQFDYGSLRVGGKLRYLTNLNGVELFAAGNYVACDEDFSREGDLPFNDGFEFLVGLNLRLGGNSNSLVEIDRSNAVDTRVWHCEYSQLVG